MVVDAFAAVPVSLLARADGSGGNPDSNSSIRLHFEIDPDQIPPVDWCPSPSCMTDVDAIAEVIALRPTYFGTATERSSPNSSNILAAKSQIYRYGVFAINYNPNRSSGLAETPGEEFAITLGHWSAANRSDTRIQAGTLMHEFGHTLGLRHGGADDVQYKPNYRSVMNYLWQYPHQRELQLRSSWRLDYSRVTLPIVTEAAIDEAVGFGGDATLFVQIGTSACNAAVPDPAPYRIVSEGGAVDINNDGDSTDMLSLNATGLDESIGGTCEVLIGATDWSAIRFQLPSRTLLPVAGAQPPAPTMPIEIDYFRYHRWVRMSDPCPPDFNSDGELSPDGLGDYVNAFFAMPPDPAADFNLDGDVNADDMGDYINAYFAGC
ncbi:MAG: hypothetical protein AB7K52_09975 [Phycisphaerales bacterium]